MTEQELLALQQQVNVNTQAIEEIKEVLAQMNEASEAAATNETLIQALAVMKSCDCDAKWQTLYNEDLPKLSLNGTTLVITTRSTTEET